MKLLIILINLNLLFAGKILPFKMNDWASPYNNQIAYAEFREGSVVFGQVQNPQQNEGQQKKVDDGQIQLEEIADSDQTKKIEYHYPKKSDKELIGVDTDETEPLKYFGRLEVATETRLGKKGLILKFIDSDGKVILFTRKIYLFRYFLFLIKAESPLPLNDDFHINFEDNNGKYRLMSDRVEKDDRKKKPIFSFTEIKTIELSGQCGTVKIDMDYVRIKSEMVGGAIKVTLNNGRIVNFISNNFDRRLVMCFAKLSEIKKGNRRRSLKTKYY
jgi:hypothetical protein